MMSKISQVYPIFIELFSPRLDPNVQGCSLPLPHHEVAAISIQAHGSWLLKGVYHRQAPHNRLQPGAGANHTHKELQEIGPRIS